jgi:hypothetical protein
MAPIIIQGRIWATVLAVVLTASSAVPTSAEVIFASNINNNGEREIVSFQPPTGRANESKLGKVVFVAATAPITSPGTSAGSCRFPGEYSKALRWCISECNSLPSVSYGLYGSYTLVGPQICRAELDQCARRNSQC